MLLQIPLKSVKMADENVIEKMEMLCYLRDTLCTEGGIQKAVIVRIKAEYKRF